jgi:hypothetical protein
MHWKSATNSLPDDINPVPLAQSNGFPNLSPSALLWIRNSKNANANPLPRSDSLSSMAIGIEETQGADNSNDPSN